MCVSPQALLSALVLRVRGGGSAVTRDEIVAVLAAGCTRESVKAALVELGSGVELLETVGEVERWRSGATKA
jgi:hypothetical protein